MILVTSMNSEMTACVSWVLERERRAVEKDAIKIYSLTDGILSPLSETPLKYLSKDLEINY